MPEQIRIENAAMLAEMQSGFEYELTRDLEIDIPWSTLPALHDIRLLGNGHWISVLKKPMFSSLDNSEIRDLRLVVEIEANEDAYIGGLANVARNTTVTGCTVAGKIFARQYIGSFAGEVTRCVLHACTGEAILSGEKYVGGIVGSCVDTTVHSCANHGDIKIQAEALYVGGIAGFVAEQSVLDNNVNDGVIDGPGAHVVGGIAGSLRDVSHCVANVNKGVLQGRKSVGGIAGFVERSTLEGNANLSLTHAEEDIAGGIVGYGYATPLHILRNTVAGSVRAGGNYAGGIIGLSIQGVVIMENWMSGNMVQSREYARRVVGHMKGPITLDANSASPRTRLTGNNHNTMNYRLQTVLLNDPDLGTDGMHGETVNCPEKSHVQGFWLTCAQDECDEGQHYEDGKGCVPDVLTDDPLADPQAVSLGFRQIVASLELGVEALGRIMQAKEPILRRAIDVERDSVRSLMRSFDALFGYRKYIAATARNIRESPEWKPDSAKKIDSITVKLTKINPHTSLPIADAVWVLEGEMGQWTAVSQRDGVLVFKDVLPGSYRTSELSVPDVYEPDLNVYEVVVSDTGSVLLDGDATVPFYLHTTRKYDPYYGHGVQKYEENEENHEDAESEIDILDSEFQLYGPYPQLVVGEYGDHPEPADLDEVAPDCLPELLDDGPVEIEFTEAETVECEILEMNDIPEVEEEPKEPSPYKRELEMKFMNMIREEILGETGEAIRKWRRSRD